MACGGYSTCLFTTMSLKDSGVTIMVQDARNADGHHTMTSINTSHDQDEWHGFSQRDVFSPLVEMESIVI